MSEVNKIIGEVHVDFTAGELAVALSVTKGNERLARALLRAWARTGIAESAKQLVVGKGD